MPEPRDVREDDDPRATPDVATVLDELASLRRRLDRQATLLEQQQRTIEQLTDERASVDQLRSRADHVQPATAAGADVTDTGQTRSMGRRSLLRLAGASAVGAAAASVATVSGAAPASATTGDAILAGHQTTEENPTQLLYDFSGTLNTSAAFAVADTNDFSSNFPSALAGFANGVKFSHGVYGWSQAGGYGVVARGINTAAAGLFAEGGTAGIDAIKATASGSGTAVNATNSTGVAVGGNGLIGLGSFAAGANLRTFGFGLAPQQRTNAQLAGDLASDINKDLWYAVADGSPGTWRKVAGPNTAGALHILGATTRVYDSRNFPPNTGVKGTLGAGGTRTVACSFGGAAPAGATAVLVNLTVVSDSAQGFLAAFRNGIAWPGNSSINWDRTGETVANTTIVGVDSAAVFSVYASNPVDFIVDVIGFFR